MLCLTCTSKSIHNKVDIKLDLNPSLSFEAPVVAGDEKPRNGYFCFYVCAQWTNIFSYVSDQRTNIFSYECDHRFKYHPAPRGSMCEKLGTFSPSGALLRSAFEATAIFDLCSPVLTLESELFRLKLVRD